MEEIYDRSCVAVAELLGAVQQYLDLQGEMRELEEYYTGGMWLEDFDADRAGKIPKDMKRGIMTEDAIWDLLTDKFRMMKLLEQLK